MERMPARAPLARGVMLGLCVMAVVGCGGGGGNVRSDPPPPAPTSPNPPVTPPTNPPVTPPTDPVPAPVPADAHLHAIGADEVRRSNINGDGSRIVFLDSGVNFAHPSLKSNFSRSEIWTGGSAKDTGVADPNGHGTAVAQVAAGDWSGLFPGGVAMGNLALVSLRVLDDTPVDGGQPLDVPALDFIRTKMGTTPRTVLNVSTDTLRWDAGTPMYDGFADFADPTKGGALVVTAAGNAGQAQPSALARLPFEVSDTRDLQSRWLVAAAVDSLDPTRLAAYSNQCGVAKDRCLVAPGDVVVNGARDVDGTQTYRTLHGTDYAAAQVSGAAALVWSAFPYFDNELVQQTLLGSAADLGAPGVDEVFGRGLLDVEKAVKGPSRFDWGDVQVKMPDTGATFWQNDISGTGGLVVDSDGTTSRATLWLTGDNTYTGKTVIKNAAVVVDGAMASPLEIREHGSVSAFSGTWSGDVDVKQFGQLYFATNVNRGKIVFAGNFRNAGWLMMDSTTNAVFKRDFALESTSELGLHLGAPPIHVEGAARIDGMVVVYNVVPGYVAKARTEILVADRGLTGTFRTLTWPMSLTLVANFGYDATTAWLDVVRADMQATASGMGLKAASVGSAHRIETAFDGLDNASASTAPAASGFRDGAAALQRVATPGEYERTLESLSGELHDADGAFAMMAIEDSRRGLEARLDALTDGQAQGAWSQQLDGLRGWSSFDVSTNGWMLGFDQRGGDGVTVGASLSETSGDAWHSQRFDRERNRQVDGQMYASWNVGAGYVLGTAAFGHMQRWLQREVLLGDDGYRVSSDYAHRYGAMSLQAGRRMLFGRAALTPYIGAQALRLDRDGFSEEGASGFGLTSDDASMSALQAMAGARWSHRWNGDATRWSLSGRVEWQHLLSQNGTQIQARFTGMDAWAPIVADGLDRNVGVFGLGLAAGIGRASTLRLDLDSRRSDGEQWAGAMLNWSTAF